MKQNNDLGGGTSSKDIDFEPTKLGKLPVTKIDAAVRQLETAITLWFHDAEPVSIATLTYAGYQIISDLNKNRNGKSMLLDEENKHIKPKYQKAFRRIMRATPNFFKHADQDPDETHYFKPEVTQFILFEAITIYSSWNMEIRPLFKVYSLWITLVYPKLFKEDYVKTFDEIVNEDNIAVRMGKRKFYETCLVQNMEIY